MSFVDHLEALRWHIIRIIVAISIGSIAAFSYMEFIYKDIILAPSKSSFISYQWLCQLGKLIGFDSFCENEIPMNLQNIDMTGQFRFALSSSFVIGIIVAFPYIVYELWRFIKPALKSKEVLNGRTFIFFSSLLFFLGVIFGYFVLLPYSVNFFSNFSISPDLQNIITIKSYISLFLSLILGSGLFFELPVIMYFLTKADLVTPDSLRSYRKIALVIVLSISAIITPPDLISQIIVSIPIMMLYEVGILVSKRVYKKKMRRERELVNS